jgi:hypothetical protein
LRFALKHLPPESFLRDFVPVERDTLLACARGSLALALRMAYLKAIPSAARLYPRFWRADVEMVSAVLRALQQLYLYPIPDSQAASVEPSLDEFRFRSSVPVVGPLIAGVRSLWYGVAARWAVRHLAEQQEAFNRQVQALHAQQENLNQLYVRSLALLSEEAARLAQAVNGCGDNNTSK